MVAATLGVPVAPAAASEQQVSSFAPGLQHLIDAHTTYDLASLQAGKRRGGFWPVDYWHQHALRNAIRHLTYTISSPVAVHGKAGASERHVQQLALLSSLLTMQPARPPLAGHVSPSVKPEPFKARNVTALWLATVRGIRAGPQLRIS